MCPAVGKRGRRRNCQWKEPTANEWDDGSSTPIIRRNDAGRRVVDSAAPGFCRVVDFHHLFHLGCVSGKELFHWQLHFAVLFARNFRRFASQLVWIATRLVARLAAFFSRAAGSLGSCRIPCHLLLLSRRILQSLLGRSAGVYCR